MRKYAVVLAVVLVFVVSFFKRVSASDLVWEDIARGNMNIRTVLINPDNHNIIYIGSRTGVFKSEDAGVTWRNILSIRGTNRQVNFLSFALSERNFLYAATGNGLYFSHNQGRDWKRIFKGKNYLENECTTLAVLPYGIYLGTKVGPFVSKDNGRSWHKETGEVGKSHILAIAYNPKEPNCLYVACVNGVFRTQDAGQSWERIFIAHPIESDSNVEEVVEDQGEEERFSNVRYISIGPNNTNYIYLATSSGVYRSQDKGKSWDLLTDYGLLSKEIKFLLISLKSTICAVTKSGIFEYTNERWHELSLGLTAEDIRFLAQDNHGNLYAACNNGLFKAKIDSFGTDTQDNTITMYFKDEPKINDIHAAAIKYAEVEPDKIKDWRRKAKLKAILPKLTVGLDKSESTNYEIYTSATTKYVYEGPYDKSNGWDVTLSWDLGELIWNDDQTSIDVRSRLMVELRDDILDEVTKIYFERLRVKIELDNLSIEDRKKRLEKELRLEELTASLDALTGGYFSQRLKTKSGS